MRRVLTLLIALVLSPVLATNVFGHAVLIAMLPADGSVIAETLAEVVLNFSEPVAPMAFRLLHPDGAVQELTGIGVDARITVDVPTIRDAGTYPLEWHVVSADGHPVVGNTAISIGAAGGGVGPAAPRDRVVAALLWVATALMFVGAFFGVGGSHSAPFSATTSAACSPAGSVMQSCLSDWWVSSHHAAGRALRAAGTRRQRCGSRAVDNPIAADERRPMGSRSRDSRGGVRSPQTQRGTAVQMKARGTTCK